MINVNMDRDSIKSQLIEGLKQSKKVLKNKKGKTNRDLVFNINDKQFLITRGSDDRLGYLFLSDNELREEYIEKFLDRDIESSSHGTKELCLYIVGDMSRYNLNPETGIKLPGEVGYGKRFNLNNLDDLIDDEMTYMQKVGWEKAVEKNFIRTQRDWTTDTDIEVNYEENAKEDAIPYIDVLVEKLIKYLDDNYLPVCAKTNELFVEMFKGEGTALIHNSQHLSKLGKSHFSQKFLESIGWEVSREDFRQKHLLVSIGKDEEGNLTEGRVFDSYDMESFLFKRIFSYGTLSSLAKAGVIESDEDAYDRAWKLAENEVKSRSMKEVA